MRSIFYILFTLLSTTMLWAQQSIEGIVFDAETKQRIGKVLLKNLNQKIETYNNLRGEFEINANSGDVIVAIREEFKSDTIIYNNQSIVLFNLQRDAIYIKTVEVIGKRSPEEILKQEKESFNKAYKLSDPGSIFSVGQTGAGLSIGSIYNLISREGKNARRLTQIIQRDYEENMIDYKFSPSFVHQITGLEDESLKLFMQHYRPTYSFVLLANRYELSQYIKSKYILFKLNPNLRHLPELPDIKLDVNN